MIQLLQQRNELSNIKLYQTEIVEYKKDKNYDILQVMIRAAMRNVFISKRLRLSTNNDIEQFIEYWSFIRKRGVRSPKGVRPFR